jgi:ketosteroid isomerase-like protein
MALQTSPIDKKSHVVSNDVDSEIRQCTEDFFAAVNSGDIDKIMSFYTPDVVAFDMTPPLQFVGVNAYRKSWENGLGTMKEIKFEARDYKVFANDDLAFAHCLSHCTGEMKNGKKMDMWVRWTGGLRKIGGKWLVAHEQISVPIDMKTDKGIFDLKPEQVALN